MTYVRNSLGQENISERRACRVLGQRRPTQRRQAHVPDEEPRLIRDMVALATQYGRYGYRRVTALLRRDGWKVNHKRIERLWRQEGLKVPKRQPKRKRLWFNDGSCVRLRPAHRDHVWSYDFVQTRTHDGRPVRMLTVIDEFTRECLAIASLHRLATCRLGMPDAAADSFASPLDRSFQFHELLDQTEKPLNLGCVLARDSAHAFTPAESAVS